MGYKDSVEDLKLWKAADLIESLQADLRDEKIKVARLQMIAYGAVDEEYAAYYNLSLQGEPTEKE